MNTQKLTTYSLSDRAKYRSSNQINAAGFMLWVIPALAVAMALACFMYWLFHVGHYYVVIVPFVCAFAVMALTRLAVAKGHCRNKLVGALTGALLGVVLYIGSYYVGMVHTLGPVVEGRPGVLVEYIRLRQATDVVRESYETGDDSAPSRRRSSEFMNWFRFALEGIGVVLIVAIGAGRRAGKTYCEQCRRWMQRETSPFDPAHTESLLESLSQNTPRKLASLCHEAPFVTVPNTTVAVDYCPTLKEGAPRDCPVFLSVKQVTAQAQGATLDAFEQAKGKVLARGVAVNRDELAALAPRFPVFESYTGPAAVAALRPEVGSSAVTKPGSSSDHLAEIVPLPEDYRGKVLTRAMMWKGNLCAGLGLVGFILGLVLLAWGASRLEAPDRIETDMMGIGMCVVGGTFVLAAVTGMLFDFSFGGNRMLRSAFKAEIARRDGVLVAANDPEARFVEVVPKLNWGKAMLDNASDIGLLVVDRTRKEIRFEGDRERWRLPAASIASCALERFVHGQGGGATTMYYVVLRATGGKGFWEAPVRERHSTGLFSGKRKKITTQLQAEIQALCDSKSIARA